MLLKLAGSITALVLVKQINEAYNRDMNQYGLSAGMGSGAIVLGFFAFFFALLAATFFIIRARRLLFLGPPQ